MNADRVKAVLDNAKDLARKAIEHAAKLPAGVSGEEREAAALEYLTERVTDEIERRDEFLPVIGRYLDLPICDYAQQQATRVILRAFIRNLYAEKELEAVTL